MNPVVWLGTPDVQMMPGLAKGVSLKGGSHQHQFINPLAFEIPQPGTNGVYRLPYLRGPAFMEHDLTVLKEFPAGEGKNLELRMSAFNVFNHPLVSFNNNNNHKPEPRHPGWTRWSGADAKNAPVPGFRHCEYQGGKQACGAGSEVYVLTGSCRRTARRSGGSAG